MRIEPFASDHKQLRETIHALKGDACVHLVNESGLSSYANSEHAGGHARNRRFDGVFELPAGAYVAHFKTDARHHASDFDDAPPRNPDAWGMTIAKVHE